MTLPHGWIFLDKPLHLTSNDAVTKVRRAFKTKKAGHAGTLDPLASGVLPIALGEATKTMPYIADAPKTYSFIVQWGRSTTTGDIEGETVATSAHLPTPAEIAAIIPKFLGAQQQTPPAFSALKINGQRAYALARAGEEVVLQPRTITIYDLQYRGSPTPDTAMFSTTCSKGTYIRVLGQDIALQLGTFAHIVALRRTKVGQITENQCVSLDAVLANPVAAVLQPLTTVLDDISALAVSAEDAHRIRQGQPVVLTQTTLPDGLAYCTLDGVLIALGRIESSVFAPQRGIFL